jgi:hypothetical protein
VTLTRKPDKFSKKVSGVLFCTILIIIMYFTRTEVMVMQINIKIYACSMRCSNYFL